MGTIVYPNRLDPDDGSRRLMTPDEFDAWSRAAAQDPHEDGPLPPCGHESERGSWWPQSFFVDDEDDPTPTAPPAPRPEGE